jgi:hypothetical protein
MEAILVGTNQAKNAGTSSVARVTASVLSWTKSNTSKGAGGADPSAADGTGTRTDGTQRVFTEANLKTVLQSVWNNGGKPDTIMTGGFNKQVFSTFTGRASPIEEAKSKKITASVDAYESDFGTLKVVANRFSRPRDVLILQTDMWALAYLNGRKMVSMPLAKTGDSERREVLSEYALEARNEKASGGGHGDRQGPCHQRRQAGPQQQGRDRAAVCPPARGDHRAHVRLSARGVLRVRCGGPSVRGTDPLALAGGQLVAFSARRARPQHGGRAPASCDGDPGLSRRRDGDGLRRQFGWPSDPYP